MTNPKAPPDMRGNPIIPGATVGDVASEVDHGIAQDHPDTLAGLRAYLAEQIGDPVVMGMLGMIKERIDRIIAMGEPETRLARAERIIDELIEAITAEVNEKGGGGFILARLSDARAFRQTSDDGT